MLASSVLSPLDGTKLSESALLLIPFLKSLGTKKLRIVSVWEEPEEAHAAKGQIREITERGQSLLGAYLQEKRQELSSLGLDIESDVCVGKPAEKILTDAEERQVELIAIATHGRSGQLKSSMRW